MPASGRRRPQRSWAALGFLAIAVAAVCAVAVSRPWAAPTTPAAVPAEPPGAAVAPLVLPDSPEVLLFGDSWVYGSAARVPELGFAYLMDDLLGWRTTVDGVRGSGYLRPGIDGPPYGERIAALDASASYDLVIVEGTINDRALPADGYRDAVNAAWDDLAAIYPDASFVILGPAPQVLPVEKATARIDADLADLAAQRGWWYISPLSRDWIVASNYLDVIDTGAGRDHPSTEGHAYLAERLAAAIVALQGAGGVSADADEHDRAGTPG
ncbi:SGNH/GDSL hydrolase family protein [Microbacter sp. GSS18]|nr:SGNH/GDSL hydrolase family protein [Microbacter sp. GSS18]